MAADILHFSILTSQFSIQQLYHSAAPIDGGLLRIVPKMSEDGLSRYFPARLHGEVLDSEKSQAFLVALLNNGSMFISVFLWLSLFRLSAEAFIRQLLNCMSNSDCCTESISISLLCPPTPEMILLFNSATMSPYNTLVPCSVAYL